MDVVKLLKQDHRTVKGLFGQYKSASSNKQKKDLANKITKELSIHAGIEEQFLYPTVRERNEKFDDQVLEALEEHHVAKATLKELESMYPSDERFDAKMTVLMENIRHHIKEEEEELFPKLPKIMSKEELQAIGEVMEQAKKAAPTHPHPMAPDSPPGNHISDLLAKVLDSGKDIAHNVSAEIQKRVRRGIGR